MRVFSASAFLASFGADRRLSCNCVYEAPIQQIILIILWNNFYNAVVVHFTSHRIWQCCATQRERLAIIPSVQCFGLRVLFQRVVQEGNDHPTCPGNSRWTWKPFSWKWVENYRQFFKRFLSFATTENSQRLLNSPERSELSAQHRLHLHWIRDTHACHIHRASVKFTVNSHH